MLWEVEHRSPAAMPRPPFSTGARVKGNLPPTALAWGGDRRLRRPLRLDRKASLAVLATAKEADLGSAASTEGRGRPVRREKTLADVREDASFHDPQGKSPRPSFLPLEFDLNPHPDPKKAACWALGRAGMQPRRREIRLAPHARLDRPQPDLFTGKQRASRVKSVMRVRVVAGERVGFRRSGMGDRSVERRWRLRGAGSAGADGPGLQVTRRGSLPRARCQIA